MSPEKKYHSELDRHITEDEGAEYARRHAALINEIRDRIDERIRIEDAVR